MDRTTHEDAPPMVSLSDAALLLRMNRERVLRRVQDGRLEGRQLAGRWFVARASLERLRAALASPAPRSRAGVLPAA